MYRTAVSGVFRRRDFGFAVCGKNLASVSHFVAGIRHSAFEYQQQVQLGMQEWARAIDLVFGGRLKAGQLCAAGAAALRRPEG
jgi:hypothetical protein